MRWQGLIDAKVVAHSKEIRNIDWPRATGSSGVIVWATAVLLDELDRLAHDQRKSPAAGHVRVFNRWLRPLLPQALEPAATRFPEIQVPPPRVGSAGGGRATR